MSPAGTLPPNPFRQSAAEPLPAGLVPAGIVPAAMVPATAQLTPEALRPPIMLAAARNLVSATDATPAPAIAAAGSSAPPGAGEDPLVQHAVSADSDDLVVPPGSRDRPVRRAPAPPAQPVAAPCDCEAPAPVRHIYVPVPVKVPVYVPVRVPVAVPVPVRVPVYVPVKPAAEPCDCEAPAPVRQTYVPAPTAEPCDCVTPAHHVQAFALLRQPPSFQPVQPRPRTNRPAGAPVGSPPFSTCWPFTSTSV